MNRRGAPVDALVARQSTHKEADGEDAWGDDCGLCALKNVTSNASFTLPAMLAVARPMQAAIDAEVAAGAEAKARIFEEKIGNFNTRAIEGLLETQDYACARLSEKEGGKSGMARALVEQLCIASGIGPRVCGVVWRLGVVEDDGKATGGHWCGASYEHSDKPLTQRRWYEKDSLLAAAKPVSFEAVFRTLDGTEHDNRDFVVIGRRCLGLSCPC